MPKQARTHTSRHQGYKLFGTSVGPHLPLLSPAPLSCFSWASAFTYGLPPFPSWPSPPVHTLPPFSHPPSLPQRSTSFISVQNNEAGAFRLLLDRLGASTLPSSLRNHWFEAALDYIGIEPSTTTSAWHSFVELCMIDVFWLLFMKVSTVWWANCRYLCEARLPSRWGNSTQNLRERQIYSWTISLGYACPDNVASRRWPAKWCSDCVPCEGFQNRATF